MNDFSLPVLGSLAVGLLLGPILWWGGKEILRYLAWHLEFGRKWLARPSEQNLQCVSCGTPFFSDEAACSGCGKSRELAFLASLREVEIASEQILRLNQQGAVDPLSSAKLEEALNRQRAILLQLRRPQKPLINHKVELILPDDPIQGGGYIDPDTFHESRQPGAHPLRLKPITKPNDGDLPPGRLPQVARMGGLVFLVVSLAAIFHGVFPPGSKSGQIPGLAECWTGLALFLGGVYSLAFGRGSAVLARFAVLGTAFLVPAFWVLGPWVHGAPITPMDWALSLVCATLCFSGSGLMDRYLETLRSPWEEFGPFQPIDRPLHWCASLFFGALQLGAMAGLSHPDSWFGPWTLVNGQIWGFGALFGLFFSLLALQGPNSHFSLIKWIFEISFGLILAVSCWVGSLNPPWGASVLAIGLSLQTMFLSLLLSHLIPGIPRLLRPSLQLGGPWVLRTLVFLVAVALVQRKAIDPHPWIGAGTAMATGLSVLLLGGLSGFRSHLLLGLVGFSLGTGLISRQIMAELHHDLFEQFWLALGGFVLGASVSPWLARTSEYLAHSRRLAHQSATHWLRLASVQILLAGGLAACLLAITKKSSTEVHFWANPATLFAWIFAAVSVGQIRSLRGHGFALLAFSGAILLWGFIDKATNRGTIAIQSGLTFLGLAGLLLSLGVGRLRPITRRLSKVSVSWSGVLCTAHLVGTWALFVTWNHATQIVPGVSLVLPGLLGSVTWMFLARNRNIPGFAWVGAFWLLEACLPLCVENGNLSPSAGVILFGALVVTLFFWSVFASQRMVQRRLPLGPYLAGSLGLGAIFVAYETIAGPDIRLIGVTFASLVVLTLAHRIVKPNVLVPCLLGNWGALVLIVSRYLQEVSGLETWVSISSFSAVGVLGLGLALRLTQNLGYLESLDNRLEIFIQIALGTLSLGSSILAIGLMVGEDNPSVRLFLSTIPFILCFCLVSLDDRWDSRWLTSLGMALGFMAWFGMALVPLGPELSNRWLLSLGAHSLIGALGFVALSWLPSVSGTIPTELRITHKTLKGLVGTLTLLSGVALVCLGSFTDLSDGNRSISLACGLLAAAILFLSFVIQGWKLGADSGSLLNFDQFRQRPLIQEFHGYGAVFSMLTGIALGALLVLKETTGLKGEFSVQVGLGIGVLFAGLMYPKCWKWFSRPLAFQCLGGLFLISLWNFAIFLAIRIEFSGLGYGLFPSNPISGLLQASVILALAAMFVKNCRENTPATNHAWGNQWGNPIVENLLWFSASLALPSLLIQQNLISMELWEQSAIFLIVPGFGMIAWWARYSGLREGAVSPGLPKEHLPQLDSREQTRLSA